MYRYSPSHARGEVVAFAQMIANDKAVPTDYGWPEGHGTSCTLHSTSALRPRISAIVVGAQMSIAPWMALSYA